MSFLMTVIVAVRALRRNALRTALTMLGIIIGVAAVIVMVAIGTGARTSIEQQIRSTGTNMITVNAGSGGFGPVRQGQGAVTTLDGDLLSGQLLGGFTVDIPGVAPPLPEVAAIEIHEGDASIFDIRVARLIVPIRHGGHCPQLSALKKFENFSV